MSLDLWRFNVAGNSKTYLGLHVKCPILTKCEISRRIFVKMASIKFHVNASNGSRADTCGQTEGRTDEQPDTISAEESAFVAI
jgi:hypothetical protein